MSTNPTTQNGAGSSSAGPSSVASSSNRQFPRPDVTTHTSTRSPTHSATNGNTPHTSSLIGLVSTSIGPTETSILDLPSGQIGESHSSALSTAAVIGTAVGILGCAILTLIMGVYIIRRKRRQRSDMHEQTLTEIFKETSMPGSTGPPSSPASPSVSHDVAHFPMRSNIQAFSGRPTSNVQSGIIVMQPVGIVSGDDDAIYAAYQNQQQQQQMQQQQMQQMQHMQHLDHLTMQQSMNMQQADRAAFPVFPGGTQAGYGYMTPQDPNHNRGAAMTSMESPLYGSNGYPTRPPSPTGYSSYYDNYQSIYTTLHPSATNHLSYQEEPHVYMLDGNGIVSPRIQGDDMAAGPLSPLAMNVDTRPDSESSSGGDQDVHTNHQSSDTLSRLISLTRAASFEAGSSLPRTGVSNNMNAPPSLPLPRHCTHPHLLEQGQDHCYQTHSPYREVSDMDCPLSGLLFNLFINDILDGVAPITVPGLPRDTNPIRGLMYADDVAVFADSEQSLLAASDCYRAMDPISGKCRLVWPSVASSASLAI
ncbi:hypothetical protein BASA81_014630 [Batrachochytrium salamandrivorans]|nr:hypothetical protein BASA81_014630 [Batrachochytrium salamandrivorans]